MGFIDDYIRSYNIYLGSRSPRRKLLLESLGLDFKVWIKEELSETFPGHFNPVQIAEYLAGIKARCYMDELIDKDILITADTIVARGDEILEKPGSREEAVESLIKLSDGQHTVITGVCLCSADKSYCFNSQTVVKFAMLEREEVEFYVDNYEPYDKAGAYGIQEWIGFIGVESIQGSYFNVMGLPVQSLYRELKRFTGYQH
jgi:septum formation protein